MRRSPELMQFEIGMSTMRYLPANGTAGLERSLVSGKSRVPAPPPMMTARVFSVVEGILEVLIGVGPRAHHGGCCAHLSALPLRKIPARSRPSPALLATTAELCHRARLVHSLLVPFHSTSLCAASSDTSANRKQSPF